MTRTLSRKPLVVAAVAAALLVFWFCWSLYHASPPAPKTLDFRIAGKSQITNGAMLVSFVLSNGNSGSLNVIDDTAGNPFLTLTTNYYDGRQVSGPLANSLKLNLAPGASLTNNVWITNPPPRFQIRTLVRDFGAERRAMLSQTVKSLAVKAKLLVQGLRHHQGVPLRETLQDHIGVMPTSPWIQPAEYQQ